MAENDSNETAAQFAADLRYSSMEAVRPASLKYTLRDYEWIEHEMNTKEGIAAES